MRLSFKWLNDYLKLNNIDEVESSSIELNQKLTEVDGIEDVHARFEKIYIGKIEEIKEHPNADRLHIVSVDIGKEKKLSIVCGANNIYEGMIVPVSLPGSIVFDESDNSFEVKVANLRGVESEGMLCSARELGIGKDHSGIVDLSNDKGLKIGSMLDDIFNDKVLKIENKAITHRPDCFSHIGIAKELSAILKTKRVEYINFSLDDLKFEKKSLDDKDQYILSNDRFNSKNDLSLKVQKGTTRRYTTITLKGVEIQPSPIEIQARLISVGLRPINNIVDLTNYVMLDIGQPLHAFDLDFSGHNFEVRTGKKGEELVTLDNIKREITDADITITDGKKPLDLGGIIGGLDSGIKESTKNVALVSDNFDPTTIRRTSWRLGVRTDAVTIFEKNIDTNLTLKGIVEFVGLYEKFYPNTKIEVSQILDYYPDEYQHENRKTIVVNLDNIRSLLGIDISYEQIEKNFDLLDIKIEKKEGETLTLSIPSIRKDLNIEEDIAEEIVRMYGYANIENKPYLYKLRKVKKYAGRDNELKARTFFVDRGYFEIEPYIFAYSKEESDLGFSGVKVEIDNPINSEIDILKTSTLPELAKFVRGNSRFFSKFGIFELSKLFEPTKGDELPIETKIISGASFANFSKLKRNGIDIQSTFYETKALIKGLIEDLRVPTDLIEFRIAEEVNENIFNKGLTLDIYLNERNRIGQIGVSSERLIKYYDINNEFVLFEIYWDLLLKHIDTDNSLKPYSKQPSIEYDISFYINTSIHASQITKYVKSKELKYQKEVEIIDEFRKGDGTKSLTLRIVFNNPDSTLRLEDIESSIEELKSDMQKDFKAHSIEFR